MGVDRRMVLAGAGGALGSLDTALNVAFPALVEGLDITIADLQWVVVAYVLSYGGLLLAAGQLGDRFGHRRLLTLGAAGSAAAMAGCALAPSFGWFLLARVAQGVAAALALASAPALATLAAAEADRGRAVAVFQAATGIGAAVGPLVGGVMVQLGGWPAVFWFRIPIALAMVALALTVAESGDGRRSSTDVVGAVVVTLGLTAGLLAVNAGRSLGPGRIEPWLAAVATVALAVAYVRRSRRHPAPIIDPALFASRPFVVANALPVLANGAMFVAWLLVPTLVVVELGASEVAGGFVLAASPAAMGLVSPLAGRWRDRSGPERPVVVGLAVEVVGLAWLAAASPASTPLSLAGAMAVIGVGLGLFGVPNMAMVMAAMPRTEQGTAGGLSLVSRTTGIVIGVAASAALFDRLQPTLGFFDAYRITVLVSVAAATAAVVLATAGGSARSRVRAVAGVRTGRRAPHRA